MNTEQIKDMHLLYNAVYDEELRGQFDEYNNTVYDEDIVEVATEYFYSYGLNSDGIDILIENVGLESFVEYVYELSEDLYDLTEARRARKRTGGESYAEVKAKIDAKEAAKKKVSTAVSEKKEVERTQPESRGAESEAEAKQPKSKKPERKSIGDRISNAIKSGVDRHNKATATAERLAGETGKTLGKLAKGVGSVAGQFGSGAGIVGKASKKVLFGEEVEAWVNQLVEEGYDLSEYTWEEMYEAYLNESGWHRRNPDQIGSSNDPDVRMRPERSSSSSSSSDKKPTWTPLDDKKEYRRTVYNNYGKTGREDAVQRAKNKRDALRSKRKASRTQSESFDLFDTILEHLIAEGYADTNESALAIMANMSEEWRQSIVEGGFNSSGRYDVGGGRTVGPVAGAVRSLFGGNLPKGQTYVPPSPQNGTNRPPAVPSSKGDSGKLTDFGAGGGKAKLKTGMSVGQVERQGRRNKGDYSG